MKRNFQNILLVIAFIIIYMPSLVNAQAFRQGDHVISAGYGFGVIDNTSNDGDNPSNTNTSPMYIKYEYDVTDGFAFGINVAYGQYNMYYGNNYGSSSFNEEDSYSTYSILLRLNWHFGRLSNFDPYWGFGLGYREEHVKEYINNIQTSNAGVYNNFLNLNVGAELTIGGRYYLSNAAALYVETGLAKSVVQFGVSYKIRKK